MATIGTFTTTSPNTYTGTITTAILKLKFVHIVPETSRPNENSPTHRIFVRAAEIGAGWAKKSETGRDYLSLKLDDPSFPAAIYANMFKDDEGEGHSLIWSRPTGNRPHG